MSTDTRAILERLREYAEAAGQDPMDRRLVMSSRDLDRICRDAVPAQENALTQILDRCDHPHIKGMEAGGADWEDSEFVSVKWLRKTIRDALAPLGGGGKDGAGED